MLNTLQEFPSYRCALRTPLSRCEHDLDVMRHQGELGGEGNDMEPLDACTTDAQHAHKQGWVRWWLCWWRRWGWIMSKDRCDIGANREVGEGHNVKPLYACKAAAHRSHKQVVSRAIIVLVVLWVVVQSCSKYERDIRATWVVKRMMRSPLTGEENQWWLR